MKRELIITLVYFGILIELISAIIGSIFYYKYKTTFLKFFAFLLWYTALNEISGILIREYISKYNAIIYNIYYCINFTYLLLIYRHYINNIKYRKLIFAFILIYYIVLIINSFFENYLIEFQSVPYIMAATFIITSISIYFVEILNTEKVLYVKKNLLFWISVGLLLFYIGNIPFRILRNYYEDLTDAKILVLLNVILAVIMNACYIIGFIWSDKKRQY
ncbi:hypothetical protein ACSTS3_15305 [Aquimarina muelleri]|uniref:hypothetical protein n=1 Tax=Aquimarina muelleri TaxID=279356 RepID=UPI003F682EEC